MTEETAVRDRTKFLGGSDVAAALGISKWRTPAQLAEEKRRPRAEGSGPEKPQLKRGKRWESVALEMLCEALAEKGWEVTVLSTNKAFTDPEYGFLAAEIDAELELRMDGVPPAVVNAEIKTVHPFALKEWHIEEGNEGGSLPIYYEAQVQHGLMITGRQITVVGALVGADVMIPMITKRDDDLIATMRPRLVDFWQRYVLGGQTPDPVNIDDVRRLYAPKLDGVEASEDIFYQYLRLKAVIAEQKAREAEREAIEFAVARYMGEHKSLMSRDGKELVRFDMMSGKWFDETALKVDNPKLFKHYQRDWQKRVLKVK